MATLNQGSSAGRGLISIKDRKDPHVRFLLLFGWLMLAGAALLCLAPIIWMVIGSFRSASEMYAVPQHLIPNSFQTANYEAAIQLIPFALFVVNSLILCFGVVLGQVVTAAMAGYALSKLRVRFAGAWILLFLTSLMVPMELLALPQYLLMRHFPWGPALPDLTGWNLLDSYAGLILPSIFSAFSIFVAKDAMDSVPREILDAARIDGCNEWKVFSRFAVPMVKPSLGILALFAFVTQWNSFFWPLIVVNNPNTYPLMLGIQKLIDTGEPWNVVMAALTLSAIPSILLLVLFQRTLVRGIAYTGLFG
jgi:multiple sugar transport system permease protein